MRNKRASFLHFPLALLALALAAAALLPVRLGAAEAAPGILGFEPIDGGGGELPPPPPPPPPP
ncbi:MAG: hypothetical protein KBC36_06110, partial [Spirochaetia bacterium]|nr:hypothetical protein [Spirochaetia bacterium]